MANALYDKGREGFLSGSMAWIPASVTATWRVALVSSYNVQISADTFKSDIPVAQLAAISTYLTNRGAAAGIASAANITIPGVSWAATLVAIVLYNDSGASQTSLLGAYIDTASGLPLLANGGNDITITWDTGSNKIFKL